MTKRMPPTLAQEIRKARKVREAAAVLQLERERAVVQQLKTELMHNRAALVDAVKMIGELMDGELSITSWSQEDTTRFDHIAALSIL